MNSVHFSVFLDSPQTHGGVKRSRQLSLLSQQKKREVLNLPTFRDLLKYYVKNPRSWISGLVDSVKLLPYVSFRGWLIGYLYSVWFRGVLRRRHLMEIHFEICSGPYLIFGFLAANAGKYFFAYPHNIEFMVPDQQSKLFRSKIRAQQLELEIYFKASTVFTISEFDTAILKCFGAKKVETLNFEPIGKEKSRLLSIKKERTFSAKERFLILGTIANKPTKSGMIDLLNLIREAGGPAKFWLVGFGTEELISLAPENVMVLGSVSRDKLNELMVSCIALVIKQPPTTGMLTRIIEGVHADIPIYVFKDYLQAHALQSHNVNVISSLNELPQMI
jgi:hypothetical protein